MPNLRRLRRPFDLPCATAMTIGRRLLLADEQRRLQECSKEQIHLPGSIQPHGALLVVDAVDLRILQVSENCATVLGFAVSMLAMSDLGLVIDDEATVFVRAKLAASAMSAPTSIAARVNGRLFDVIVHRVGEVGLVEFEPAVAHGNGRDYISSLHEAIAKLSKATDIGELRRTTASGIRELTGFDQVMIYHFHPDGHGEVVADDHVAGMTSYLGSHFPASDIPVQARRIYLHRGSGLIASSDYEPAVLVPVNNLRSGGPLDLSLSELRSVSPHHLEFMRNMGQGASFTLSLVLGEELLGLITCAHRAPRRLPLVLRRTCEVLAKTVVLQLDAMARTGKLTRQMQTRDIRATLVEQIEVRLEVPAALTELAVTVLDLIAADGAAVCMNHRFAGVGETPNETQMEALLAALTQDDGRITLLLTESLPVDRPDLARLVPSVAGLFVLPVGNTGDCLVWFRRDLVKSIDWLGAQSPDNRRTPLSPRTSFDLWRQTVNGRSAAWDEMEIVEANELGRDIDQFLLHDAEAQLARLALHDPLTGLPNRRLLVDLINSALARAARDGHEVAILFCDLDDFKPVNDTAGHAAGDAVLIEAATRLTSILRAGDSVARVGGDEFVIVLEHTSDDRHTPIDGIPQTIGRASRATGQEPPDFHQAVAHVAERIKTELTRPIRYEGHDHVISVSVGITFATPGYQAEELLHEADMAMYKAKQNGKNRAATFDNSLLAAVLQRPVTEHAL
jgi:two-component system, chemotaxis family, sensor kinase Cph1